MVTMGAWLMTMGQRDDVDDMQIEIAAANALMQDDDDDVDVDDKVVKILDC